MYWWEAYKPEWPIVRACQNYYNGDLRKCRLLDMGCGDGSRTAFLTRALSLMNRSVHGFDRLPENTIPTKNKKLFQYHYSDGVASLPWANGSFEIVVVLHVLHHVSDPLEWINAATRLLRIGGILVIKEHDCVTKKHREVLDKYHSLFEDAPPCPVTDYKSCEQWKKIITSKGFQSLWVHRPQSTTYTYYNAFRKIK